MSLMIDDKSQVYLRYLYLLEFRLIFETVSSNG